jgi:hypothetical protein
MVLPLSGKSGFEPTHFSKDVMNKKTFLSDALRLTAAPVFGNFIREPVKPVDHDHLLKLIQKRKGAQA